MRKKEKELNAKLEHKCLLNISSPVFLQKFSDIILLGKASNYGFKTVYTRRQQTAMTDFFCYFFIQALQPIKETGFMPLGDFTECIFSFSSEDFRALWQTMKQTLKLKQGMDKNLFEEEVIGPSRWPLRSEEPGQNLGKVRVKEKTLGNNPFTLASEQLTFLWSTFKTFIFSHSFYI